jgi:iron complex outermembrane receptor protein
MKHSAEPRVFERWRSVAFVVLLAALPIPGNAQQQEPSLKRLSIEELARIDVTTAMKHAEPLSDAAAAIQVISGDDIRRAGIRTLPEALRLATGMHVARFDGHTWAISARGFNISTANKMQVMIDGRSVYTPLFSGVFWDAQDLVLDDVDRIEISRGPGATLWGANAVNGVINIVTKTAAQTPGLLVAAGGGNELGQTAIRYGGAIGSDTAFRVYGKYRYRDSQRFDTGASARDPLRSGQAGFRMESGLSGRTLVTIQGDAYKGRIGISDRPDSDLGGGNVLGRVTHTRSSGAQIQIQAFYDGTQRTVPRQFAERRDTADLDVQYRFTASARHEFVTGAGYMLTRSRTTPSAVLFFEPATRTSPLVNWFVQDDVSLVPGRLNLIVGTKLEHNDYTGVEYQPNVRARWRTGRGQTLWSAVSRAVRMPTRFDSDLRFTGAESIIVLRGNPDFRSETVLSTEVGYRQDFKSRLSVDVATFVNTYDHLRTQEPTPPAGPPIVLMNGLNARTAGVEASISAQAAPSVQLHFGYTHLYERFTLDAGSHDVVNGTAEYNDPRNQFRARAYVDLPGSLEADGAFRYVGRLPHPVIPGYSELTLRFGWLFARGELSIVGDNLLHPQHPEFGDLRPREEYRRSVFGQVTWRR